MYISFSLLKLPSLLMNMFRQLWSLMAQEQTWFGNEEWKSYGIQLLPITVASEERDDVGWVEEMVSIIYKTIVSSFLTIS